MEAVTAPPVAPSEADQTADLAIAERHRYGDPEAFEEVYSRFAGMVYNIALRILGDPFEASDVSQDIFLRIYRHLGGFRGRSSLKTWVYRVTVNCCRSRISRRPPAMESLDGDERSRPVVIDRRTGPEEGILRQDLSAMVTGALARVPSPFREAVILRDLEELSYEEIAAILSVRIGTVRSRIARGRERLRELLEGSG